jgi:hypothetical protein
MEQKLEKNAALNKPCCKQNKFWEADSIIDLDCAALSTHTWHSMEEVNADPITMDNGNFSMAKTSIEARTLPHGNPGCTPT